ncbi:MAG: dTDP-4-dehydrorhamnose reductase [Candidatus Peribacteraceae bacterium]|nr:dTDP-4-dehydrorhamnose reductase [Candidatus Peribacteraceae bacterium]
MKKILLLGANGQLGKALNKEFSSDFEIKALAKEELDITNSAVVEKICAEFQPDLMLNAAAYTAVDQAESERDLAMQINGEAVGKLAEVCKKIGTKLIHFSTDYVFDGENAAGYPEDAEANPVNFYGESKLAGEKAIIASGCNFAIIRTSWLFGDGQNFVKTMLRLAESHPEIKVVADQTGCPTYTVDLAQTTRKIILNCHSREGGNPKSKDIFHVTNSRSTTWADFARKIFELKKLPTKVISITTEEYPTPARRPKNSVLLNTKLPALRSWEEALAEFIDSGL